MSIPKKQSAYLDLNINSLNKGYLSIDVRTSGLGISLARLIKNKNTLMIILPREKKQYFTNDNRTALKKALGIDLHIDVLRKLLLGELLDIKIWNCVQKAEKQICRHSLSSLIVSRIRKSDGELKIVFKSDRFLLDMSSVRIRLKRSLSSQDFKLKTIKSFTTHRLK